MHSRIAPREHRPTHRDTQGYLNDLAAAVKTAFYRIEGVTFWRPLSLEMLHEWELTHQYELATCSERLFSRNELVEHSKHEKEIVFVDALIAKIRQGFSEGNPVAHVTLSDIEQLERTKHAIGVCKTRTIFY
jgi:hypothetical protein